MERWRWLPHDLGPFYVTVNIPEFTLRVVEEGTPIHTARVVVGKPDKQTPVISDEMEEVVFNPYWNVPNSIKNEEIAPYMGYGGGFFGGGWDTSVLKRHGLRIKYGNRDIDPDQIDWSRNDIRNFDLVQPPGPGNVLGRVKFVFPNKHDVYMHDTTQKISSPTPCAPRATAACACRIRTCWPRSSWGVTRGGARRGSNRRSTRVTIITSRSTRRSPSTSPILR